MKGRAESAYRMKKLIAIDGNSLMFRAYYAIQTAMTSRDGLPTNALHGFTAMLLKLIAMRPDYMLAAFDMHGGTFRHATYPEYKAGRRETPEDLRPQIPALQELLRRMGVAVCECYKYEADDILGTVSRMAEEQGVETLIVTGDRDALQLVSDRTHVLLTKKGITETVEFDEAKLMEEHGLTPARMIDLKALMGDSSDNIPGIKGVGEKTAKALLQKYGDLEGVLTNAENEKGALKTKLMNGADSARMSYEIGTICRRAPIDLTLDDCAFDISRTEAALPLMAKLGLKSNAARLKAIADADKPGAAHAGANAPAPAEDAQDTAEDAPKLEIKQTVTVTDRDALASAASVIASEKLVALHVDDDLTVLTEGGFYYIIKTGGSLLEPGLDPDAVFAALAPALADPGVRKAVFDGKALMHLLQSHGAELRGLEFDLTVADYLLNALNPAKSLTSLAEAVGVAETGAAAVMRLYRILERELEQKQMTVLYRGVELPLVRVLFDMEREGFAVDSDALRELGRGWGARIEELASYIHTLAGHSFNILSPRQLGTVLFDELGLPPQKKTKTGYSTDSDVLENLRPMNPIVDAVIEYRFLTKLRSTFIDAMLQKVGPDGRIRTTFNQNVTATGRISSAEPNLQNIPVRTPQGREIRKAFIASPGCTLVGADYSQIELRVLAHLSGDEALTSAFVSGGDIHARTASEVFGVPVEEVTKDMRSAAKAVNFGIVYGISEFGLANQLGVSRKTAGEYIKKYLARCTGVRDYMARSVSLGRERGYAVTLTGRRRDLPELKSGNFNTRSFGERVAMNMPVQGSAADLIKLAMVRVHDALEREGLRAKLVLQIHDELIIDCPECEKNKVAELLHKCMMGDPVAGELKETTAAGEMLRLNVPLVADVAEGRSWFDTK
ncbi:MAG: DNA polymerase I [Clostridia bacterium]|nr:DNA polymerase I [Clostridia bacterium]